MIDRDSVIESFLKNFVQKDRVERSYFELSSLKKRNKFTDRLNHSWEKVFKMKCLTRVEKEDDYAEKIQELLNFKNDEVCYVISNYDEYDDQFLPFKKVFHEIYSRGFGTILVNTSADTFFLDTEQVQGPAPRFIGKRIIGE